MGQRLVLSVRTQAREEALVNVYMHWSAYTGSSIEVANQFIEAYGNWAHLNPGEKKIFAKTDDASVARQKEIITMLMMDCWPGAHPAGFRAKDEFIEYDEDKDPDAGEKHATEVKMWMVANGMPNLAARLKDKFEYNRNDGLIGITENAIEDYQSWSEGDVDIMIDEETGDIRELYFGVMWGQEWGEACEEYEEEPGGPTAEEQLEADIYETDFVNADDFGVFTLADWSKFLDVYDKARAAGKYKIGSKKNNAVWSFIE